MAKVTTLLCDKCGSGDGVRTLVLSGDDLKLSADLCVNCVARAAEEFHLLPTMKSNRIVKVWDYDDIPRNTL